MLLLLNDIIFGYIDGNKPIILLDLLNIFHYIYVTDGNVTRSDVIDQLFDVFLLFVLARCYAIEFVLVLDVTEPSG